MPEESAQTILFDFDGVILESAGIKTWAFGELFKKYPRHKEQIVAHHKKNMGVSRFRKFDYIYRHILKQPVSSAQKQKLGALFSRLVLNKVLNCPMVPGVLAFIKKFSRKKDFFIVSGTPHKELCYIVKKRGLKKYFKGIYGSPPLKETIISTLLQKHKWKRQSVLFIGDGVSDWKAARKNKVPFIGRVMSGKSPVFPQRTKTIKNFKRFNPF